MTTFVVDGPEYWARQAPDKTAIVLGGEELTYAELDAWADAVAADLAGRGVAAGDRVGLLGANTLAYCVTAVALFKLAAVAVPMSTRLTVGEITALTTSAEPRAFVCDADLRPQVDQAATDGPGFTVIPMEELGALRGTAASARPPRPAVDVDDPAALIYTSGTTGTPKGVIFTNRTIMGFINEWGIADPGFNHDMRLLMVLPLGGAPGLLWGILHNAVRGSTLVLEPTFIPARAVELLESQQITAMVGVPLLYEAMTAQPGFADADLSRWDTAHVGGARVSEKLLKAYADKGVLLRQIYGMTEAGGIATSTARRDALTKPDRCGSGGVHTKLRVVRPDGSDCDPGEPGEILIKGPSVTPGYWRDPEATAAALKDGWMHSGDLGELDAEGSLKMVERLKDLIISGGLNIAPAEIENVIDELPAVEEVAVIAADDAKFGETPAAIVRLKDDLSAEEIVAHCNTRLADFKVPRYVIVADDALPRMASGKVAKRLLREQYPDIAEAYAKVR
ncbi:Long-chain-fatty-acid--CoA ligase FadD13 [Paraconexibacter sp. AEG42_29]|uniref:Long-chain-fatty-acid--CoA ligase FadD13 n=1 Tax=Paraconexibacter sp. AEG42_29 TaxID=2997339 RepID=A0AAU7APE9_9ACTN